MSHLTSEQRYTISVLLEQNFSKSEIAIVIKRQVRFNTELQRNCDLRSGKYDFDLAQRKYEKRQRQNQRNDLTLEIKERIKVPPSRVKSRTNSRCLLKKRLSCVHRVYLSTYLEDKRKVVFKSTNNWEKV
jgi:IS30 family transposase